MGKALSKFISVLFHPLLMTSLGVLIMFNSGSSVSVLQGEVKKLSIIVVVLFTSVFPALMVLLLTITKVVSSHELKDRRERMLPMSLAIIFYLFTFFVMREIQQLTKGHVVFLFCPAAALFVGMILNRYIKVSIHMLAIGGLLGLELILIIVYGAQIQNLFVLTLLSCGLLGTARLYLKENDPIDIYSGFAAGFLTTALIMFVALA